MRTPDFERNTLRVLQGQKPERLPLFEIFLNDEYYRRLAGHGAEEDSPLGHLRLVADGMAAAGYDYATTHASNFSFPKTKRESARTVSMSKGGVITDRASFDAYIWPDPHMYDSSRVAGMAPYLHEGQKLMVMGPGGILENAIDIVGYDDLCFMMADDPDLAGEVFDRIGKAIYGYYEDVVDADTVGFVCYNDDWGFNTQTFLSPKDMRQYVYPWTRKIVELAHKAGKPIMLHSCGYYANVIEDIIEDLKFDARHSYEDNINPVEKAYEELTGRIVVLGGIDMNFLATASPEAVYRRAKAMVEQVGSRGWYMLGSGNSIPPYIPFDNLLAMNRAALDFD